MLEDSTVLEPGSSALAAAAAAATGGSHEGGVESYSAAAGGLGSNLGDDERSGRGEEFGDRSFGGNRWPRQETLALLKIRSDMDVAFRDASVKGPLWEEVSRKLAELGFNRSAKKCKEKFENVYKYHKRTKACRTGKADGKTYRFFDQLQALESNLSIHSVSPSIPQTASAASTVAMGPQQANTQSVTAANVAQYATVPSTIVIPKPISVSEDITNPSINLTFSSHSPIQANPMMSLPPSTVNPTALPASLFQSIATDLFSNSTSSSSTSSDEKVQGQRNKRKRKWKGFFERLMKEVIDKQEDMQKRFLEAMEKREHNRMAREDAWRAQEMERINRESEILAQERSLAAAKDAAVMSYLQKIAEQQNLGQAFSNTNFPAAQPQQPSILSLTPVHPPATPVPPRPQSQLQQQALPFKLPSSVPQHHQVTTNINRNIEFPNSEDNCEQNFLPASSSRWPKVEVQALIQLRTSLDTKYQDNGSKGPLWEEISAAMRKLGYNRNAKRCKEKWENINKYFKKVKESNKRRPEDSKTCPYFHLLDAIYKEKNKFDNSSSAGKPEILVVGGAPLMVRPEQQWPPNQERRPGTGPASPGPDMTMEDLESEPPEEHHEDDVEDEGGSNFEIVTSKSSSERDT